MKIFSFTVIAPAVVPNVAAPQVVAPAPQVIAPAPASTQAYQATAVTLAAKAPGYQST